MRLLLGNRSHILPAGIVCDSCNGYFARKLEQPVLESGYFRSLRFMEAIPSKKGRVPIQKGVLGPNINVELVRDEDGATVIRVPTEHWEAVTSMTKGEVIFPTSGPNPDPLIMSRFLAKVALEALAFRLLEIKYSVDSIIDDAQIDLIRSWARRGYPGKEWQFHQRVIYESNHRHTDETGYAFQCLNEFDFLYTDRKEMYFCLAVFGVEYTLNIAGSSLDGYFEWLKKHNNASPLYIPKGR